MCLFCPRKWGAGVEQFLVGHFAFLGFEGQNWMLVVVGVLAIFVAFVWITGNRK
jgi:hypothetical protein